MAYYHDITTEKSWAFLQDFGKQYSFILIGGWAVYLYTKALKSRDIDLICDYDELMKLKSSYQLVKNDRLKKYEIRLADFDVDIYVPFFSNLAIPIEDLKTMTKSIEGFTVLAPEALLVLKQKAYEDRASSIKGEKDRIDIIALIQSVVDFKKYEAILQKYNLLPYKKALQELLAHTRAVPELELDEHAFSRFKKKLSF